MKYTPDHEWLRPESDGSVTIGITHHAQDALGDLVFVELPALGKHFAQGEPACVIESVKAAGDIKMPIAGTIIAVNDALLDAPELVNEAAESRGWFIRVLPDNLADAESLLDAERYQALLNG